MPLHHPTASDAPWTAQAYREGRDAAIAAASWCADGNTPDDHRRRMLAWLEDGDDRARDYLPREPDLSGEWADDLNPNTLTREITGEPWSDHAVIEDISQAFEDGVSDYFEDACVRELRGCLPELI